MGCYRFERQPAVDGGKNVFEFDSSAQRAIGHKYGWDPSTVELRHLTEKSDSARDFFDVYAAEYTPAGSPPKKLLRRGLLTCLTKEEIRRRTDQYLNMSPAH